MSGLREQLIRELERERHGFGDVGADATVLRSATCGDEVAVAVDVREGVIRSLTWRGHGCTVSMASASALAELAEGKPTERITHLRTLFAEALATDPTTELPADDDPLGETAVFEGLGRMPLRGRCASLAWDALAAALASRYTMMPAAVARAGGATQPSSVSTS